MNFQTSLQCTILTMFILTLTTVGCCILPSNAAIHSTNIEILSINCKSSHIDQLDGQSLLGDLGNISKSVLLLLDYNYISVIPKFTHMSSIIKISCSNNRINNIERYAFSNLPNLKTLDLSSNSLEYIPIHAFKSENGSNLPLEYLDLRENHLRTFQSNTFKYLVHLTNLQLSGNLFTKLDLPFINALNSLPNLHILNLTKTGLKNLSMSLKPTVENLRILDLKANWFENVPQVLRSGKNLEKLDLSKNAIQNLNSTSFMELEYLVELDISFMSNLKKIDQGTFSPLKSLKVLKCHHNRMLDEIHEEAFNTVKLCSRNAPIIMKKIELQNNNLKVLHENVFCCVKFDSLDIKNNPFKNNFDMKWILNLTAEVNQTNKTIKKNKLRKSKSKKSTAKKSRNTKRTKINLKTLKRATKTKRQLGIKSEMRAKGNKS